MFPHNDSRVRVMVTRRYVEICHLYEREILPSLAPAPAESACSSSSASAAPLCLRHPLLFRRIVDAATEDRAVRLRLYCSPRALGTGGLSMLRLTSTPGMLCSAPTSIIGIPPLPWSGQMRI
jgi:hypothetical protein